MSQFFLPISECTMNHAEQTPTNKELGESHVAGTFIQIYLQLLLFFFYYFDLNY